MYYIYIIRCKDLSLYTGITTDIERRFSQHKGEKTGGAKYTQSHNVLKIECVFSAQNRSSASRLEYRIKTLSKDKKERLIKNPTLLGEFLGDVIDASLYDIVEI